MGGIVLHSPILLLTLTCLTVSQAQYYDIYQGLQQLFQPYQRPVDLFAPYHDVNRFTGTHKQTNIQENKRKNGNEDRHTKKPPLVEYDNNFSTTTPKSSRKTTKSHSSHSSKVSNIRNFNTDIIFRDFYTPILEVTTKRNRLNSSKRTKTTTKASINNYYDISSATTENPFKNNNYNNRGSNNSNKPVTENIFEKQNPKEEYNTNNFESRGNSQSNRRTDTNNYNNNINRDTVNNWNPKTSNTNNNDNRNNRYINENNNYDQPINHRNPNVHAINTPNRPSENNRNNNFGLSITGLTNNNYNRGITNNRASTNNFGSNNNREVVNTNYDGTSSGFINNNNYNRGTTNNRPSSNNFASNSNRQVLNTGYDGVSSGFINNNNNVHQGTTNNRPSSNNFYSNGNRDNNPLLNDAGVIQVPVDVNQPPITNKPVTNSHYEEGFKGYSGKPVVSPDILIGPDEEDMTEVEKRQYLNMAEKMCDRYKSMHQKEVVALPLLPSPDPVHVNVSSCVPITAPLVIGGKVASINEFPHMALVGWRKIRGAGYAWKCGGSLISNQYVLTAGHCTFQDKDYEVDSGPPQAVQLGSSYLNDPGALVVQISAVIRHPKYKQRRSYYDIAVIKLKQTVRFSEVIRPACLGVPPAVGKRIIATGWGRTEFGGDHSIDLRSVSLPVWNMAECREIWGTSLKLPNGPTPESHMCAGERAGGKDTCQGDSGGPAQIQDGCVWRVVAVTSYGRSCGAANTPALYAVTQRAFVAALIFGPDDDQRGTFEDRETSRFNDRQSTFSNNRQPTYTVNSYRRQ